MAYLIDYDYRGARLAIEFGSDQRVRLRINGLVREEAALPEATGSLRLSSTVQTDYEWHEFIEAVIEIGDDAIVTTVSANGAELTRDRRPIDERAS